MAKKVPLPTTDLSATAPSRAPVGVLAPQAGVGGAPLGCWGGPVLLQLKRRELLGDGVPRVPSCAVQTASPPPDKKPRNTAIPICIMSVVSGPLFQQFSNSKTDEKHLNNYIRPLWEYCTLASNITKRSLTAKVH